MSATCPLTSKLALALLAILRARSCKLVPSLPPLLWPLVEVLCAAHDQLWTKPCTACHSIDEMVATATSTEHLIGESGELA